MAAVVGRPELHVVGRERRGWTGHDGTNCSICPKGTYKDVLGNSSCELAPLGQRQGRVQGGLPMVSLPGAVPAPHLSHTAVAFDSEYVPAGHVKHTPVPFPALYVPGGHASQTPPDSV